MANIQDNLNKIKSESAKIGQGVREKSASFLVAAFGFVAGLAWNEAVKALLEQYFPLNENNVWAKLIYAVFITLLLSVVSYYLLRSSEQKTRE